MTHIKEQYNVSDNKDEIQIERVNSLLSGSYWAKNRHVDETAIAIKNSVCFSVFTFGKQVGFARVVTDYSTVAYIADLVIDEKHQKKGLGKLLIKTIVNDERWNNKLQLLATDDAHELYRKYGFSCNNKLMSR